MSGHLITKGFPLSGMLQVRKVKISWKCPWKEHFLDSFTQLNISWNQGIVTKISWIQEMSWKLTSLYCLIWARIGHWEFYSDTKFWTRNLNSCKVPTESLEYFVNHIFLDLFGNEVFCIVYHCKWYSFCLLYNDTLFVTITSFRAEILPFRGGI